MDKSKYLITLKPKGEQLKKVIAYYYFHVCTDENHTESFFFYPNYLHALTIYIGNKITFTKKPKASNVEKNNNSSDVTCLFTANSNDKMQVNINGAFHKIGIVFYPLGFNHFIKNTLNEIMDSKYCAIDFGETFTKAIAEITPKTSLEKQLEILEEQLLKIYHPFSEPTLKKAIKTIILSNGNVKNNVLEEELQTNRKQLLRLFKKHTITTIEEYKKMVMFRNSLNFALQNKESVNLTDVALYSMYYDQSHFIKHFKSITSETPKTLLPKIKKIGNEDLFWHFYENK